MAPNVSSIAEEVELAVPKLSKEQKMPGDCLVEKERKIYYENGYKEFE